MTSISVARLALATILLCPIAGLSVSPAAAQPPTGPCVGAVETVDPIALILLGDPLFNLPLQEPDTPTVSCESQREDCMSASVQEGIYGERYVPAEAVRMCMEAYRSCIAEQPEEGSEGVG